MQMTNSEIRRNYAEARNKSKQVGILADLNECSRDEIEEILGIAKPVHTSDNVPILSVLFAQLDKVDEQIKALEEEYRRIKIAIDVVEGIVG